MTCRTNDSELEPDHELVPAVDRLHVVNASRQAYTLTDRHWRRGAEPVEAIAHGQARTGDLQAFEG